MSKQSAAKLTVITNDLAAQGERRDIPYSALFLSPLNVRKTTPTQLEELAGLIKFQGGIIENLIVYPETKKNKPTGRFGVAAGGRRLRSTGLLVANKDFSENHPMPCLIVSEDKAIELSLVENSHEAMHPADQFEAFRALIDSGREVRDVAAIFSISETIVRRRLLLANVAPRFIAEYREDKISLGVLEVLALTTNHSLQESVWDSLESYQRNAFYIRSAIMSDKVNINDHPVGRFVGAAAYEQAGGVVVRDLFSERGDGYVSDFALLARLADEMLENAALPFRESGEWAWVDIIQKLDYQTVNSYPRALMTDREPTEAEAAQIKELESQMDALNGQVKELEEHDNYGDDHDALTNQYEELEGQLELLRDSLRVIAPSHNELAGVLVGIDESGRLKIVTGRIRPEDAKAANIAAGISDAVSSGGSAVKAEHSERLTNQLTAERTVALQESVAAHPRIALAALAAYMFVKVCHIGYAHDTVCVSVTLPSLDSCGGEVIRSDRAYLLMNERRAAWEQRLVADGCDDVSTIYTRVKELPDADLYDLLAFCAASTVSAISGNDRRCAMGDLLAKDTSLNMADWWIPTASNYFGFVSKSKVLEVLASAGVADASGSYSKMKKGDLAAAAEKAMQEKRWLPSLMQ